MSSAYSQSLLRSTKITITSIVTWYMSYRSRYYSNKVILRLEDNAPLTQLHKARSTFSYFEGRLRFNWAVYSLEFVASHFSFATKTAETVFSLIPYFDASSPFVGVGFFSLSRHSWRLCAFVKDILLIIFDNDLKMNIKQ